MDWSLTGVLARSVGLKKDIRLSKKHNYSGYNTISFKSYIGINGDCYDRYLIRMFEMGESLNICNFIINKLISTKSEIIYQELINKKLYNEINSNYTYMEDLIEHFIQ